ncbi:TPA: right-handed parallel beta-helix repeat-containing protein [Pseudomonas putida]|nr:right-handed parallel beta-helix repeat-containing protein [Pseudomonas putida]
MKGIKLADAALYSIVMVSYLWMPDQSVAAKIDGECRLPNNGVLQGDTKLESACTYNQSIIISSSNISLDCDGATLDGLGRSKYGIQIVSKGQKLSGVKVSNCNVKNFSINGVMVGSGIPDFKRSNDREENYQTSPTQVDLSNLKVEGSGNVGVYLYSYVTDVTLRNSVISGSKSSGVYLEQSSKNNKLIDNVIRENGVWDGPKTGQREGLSIDSSANNLIQGNSFIRNAAGGVFLYKNCGENYSKGMAVLRWQSSNDNVIRNNKFVDEKIGVWIASRQGSNLSHRDCGDPSLGNTKKYYRDYADNNVVEGNKFCRNQEYIRIAGNNNVVRDNRADVKAKEWVAEPINMTTRLTGISPKGNSVHDNQYESCD